MGSASPKKARINSELLGIMLCPACKGSLKQIKNKIKCLKCKESYQIKEGVPYMLVKNKLLKKV